MRFFGDLYGANNKQRYSDLRLDKHCYNLYKKDLFSHFGCVNAISFSNDGELLASGGDDKRVLLWNCNRITHEAEPTPVCMGTTHLSNIFSVVIDPHKEHVLSSGNDEKVHRHNIERGSCESVYSFDEPVYCVDVPHDDACIFLTGSEDGSIQLCDVRAPNSRKRIAFSAGSYHCVTFHPMEQRIVASANSVDGASLWDTRYPEKALFSYNKRSPGARPISAMSVKFNYTGRQLLVLRRKNGPILYTVTGDGSTLSEFDHKDYSNLCTMKSACFAGEHDQYIVSGSDDFNVYVWKVPYEKTDGCTAEPHLILKGHRSIVNQVRYNRQQKLLASSGVEKIVKIWSPFSMNDCSGDTTGEEHFVSRKRYSHEDYIRLLHQTGEMTHDYENENIDEDTRMLAFFDSLVERTQTEDSDSSNDESNESSRAIRILRLLLDRNTETSGTSLYEGDTSSSDNSDNESDVGLNTEESNESNNTFGVSLEELRRIFRCDHNPTSNNGSNTQDSITNSNTSSDVSRTFLVRSPVQTDTYPLTSLADSSTSQTVGQRIINLSDIEGRTSDDSQEEEEEVECVEVDEEKDEDHQSETEIRRTSKNFETRNYRKHR